ncbi:MAG: hypothetical protein RBS55_12040 [Bacteroidales bacterium]|jgi:hypothetical protein|nr:hypothetical protein [Bacteroidales bacterium]
MSPGISHKKRNYSSVYKIYRRLRFIRHRKKQLKQQIKQQLIRETDEKKLAEARLREFRIQEKKQFKIKAKADKRADKERKAALKEEMKQMAIMARLEKEKEVKEAIERRKKQWQLEKLETQRLKEEKRLQRIQVRTKFSWKVYFKNAVIKFKSGKAKRRHNALITINSTVFFIMSYLALFFISQAVTVIAAGFFNYPATVYYFEIYFNISPEAWYHDSVKTIFSAGPLVNFILGVICLIIYHKLKESPVTFKIFFLWGFLHGVNMLFGAMLVGTLFETGVGHVISWMYIMDTGRLLYSILSIFLLVIAGMIATKPFLFSANSYFNEINTGNRQTFMLSQVFWPFLTGNIIMILVRQPRLVFYDTFILFTLVISVLAVLFTFSGYNELYFEEEDKKPGIAWIATGILILALIFFRVILGIGIRLG